MNKKRIIIVSIISIFVILTATILPTFAMPQRGAQLKGFCGAFGQFNLSNGKKFAVVPANHANIAPITCPTVPDMADTLPSVPQMPTTVTCPAVPDMTNVQPSAPQTTTVTYHLNYTYNGVNRVETQTDTVPLGQSYTVKNVWFDPGVPGVYFLGWATCAVSSVPAYITNNPATYLRHELALGADGVYHETGIISNTVIPQVCGPIDLWAVWCPIILDLDGTGIQTTGINNGVAFDINGNGTMTHTAWAGPHNGILVRDANGDGQIDNGTELFGTSTTLKNGDKAENGFEALAEYDLNGDGKVDQTEAEAAGLRIWVDANTNGIVDPGETLTFDQARVSSINVGYTDSNEMDSNGNILRWQGSFTRTDGSTGAATDVLFQAAVNN